MRSLTDLQKLIETGLNNFELSGRPSELYDPIRYMIQLGGKRLRPALVLMSHELFGGDPEKVLQPALGIEIFHNFTLLHDDIMDKAPLRRSKPTVHEKWNTDIAILSGDTMFVQACQFMMNVDATFVSPVLSLFLKTAIEVCEGQQLDMNFERQENVSHEEYIEMIGLKTAVLLGCSLSIGAICANASKNDIDHIYQFGKKLGIAFQLHDDILDVYANADKFGKQIGGDIIANKKTFLFISTLEQAKQDQLAEFKRWISMKEFNVEEKVKAVITIFDSLNIRLQAEQKMNEFFSDAMQHLEQINVPAEKKHLLIEFAEKLMVRES